jgi:hypothetical protein
MLQAIVEDGGRSRDFALAIGADGIVDFSGFSSGSLNIFRPDRGRGEIVEYIDHDFGRVTKLYHRWIHTTDAFLIPSGQNVLRVLRPMLFSRLALTGDHDDGMFVTELTLQVRAQRHQGRFSGLT